MKLMKQLQSVKGNIRKFTKYYTGFIKLTQKDDLTYLGYPFDPYEKSDLATKTRSDHQRFNQLLDDQNCISSEPMQTWVYDFIICAFKNETHHTLAKLILYRNKTRGFHNVSIDVFSTLTALNRILLFREKLLSKRMHRENESDWRPNT